MRGALLLAALLVVPASASGSSSPWNGRADPAPFVREADGVLTNVTRAIDAMWVDAGAPAALANATAHASVLEATRALPEDGETLAMAEEEAAAAHALVGAAERLASRVAATTAPLTVAQGADVQAAIDAVAEAARLFEARHDVAPLERALDALSDRLREGLVEDALLLSSPRTVPLGATLRATAIARPTGAADEVAWWLDGRPLSVGPLDASGRTRLVHEIAFDAGLLGEHTLQARTSTGQATVQLQVVRHPTRIVAASEGAEDASLVSRAPKLVAPGERTRVEAALAAARVDVVPSPRGSLFSFAGDARLAPSQAEWRPIVGAEAPRRASGLDGAELWLVAAGLALLAATALVVLWRRRAPRREHAATRPSLVERPPTRPVADDTRPDEPAAVIAWCYRSARRRLARAGVGGPDLTPREWGDLASRTTGAPVMRLVSAYERARFSGRPPLASDVHEAEQVLRRLEGAAA